MWNQKHYQEVKETCKREIKDGIKKPFDYMIIYKKMIIKDDFEGAKAVTEILKPLNYDTADTHQHIKQLWR